MPHKPFNWIYVILSPQTNKIKVGGTSDDLGIRLSKLSREGPDGNLRFLKFFRGNIDHEQEIHAHLKSLGLHDHHEWFRYPENEKIRKELEVYFDDFARRIASNT